VPTLLLGGRLQATLAAQAAAAGLGLAALALALRPLGISGLSVRRAALRQLAGEGSPFLLLGVVLALQTNVDAVMLSRLAPAEAMGWQAAALKLVGVLIFPANALISSLYPTLSRLFVEDRAAYAKTARSGLRGSLFLAVPVALGCAVFPDIGTSLFDRSAFGPAEANLRLLSVYLLLMYVTMTLGCCLSAAGRQRPWAAGQLACVAVSLAIDPLLIPWFQARMGNGGLGVCATLLLSEVLMLALAVALVPRDLLDLALLRSLARAVAAGGGMLAVAHLARGLPVLVAAGLAVAGYAVGLWSVAGEDRAQLHRLRKAFAVRSR
jgi:O-antigen/teichoic acid export membrane protein